jgi:hypothetical protein
MSVPSPDNAETSGEPAVVASRAAVRRTFAEKFASDGLELPEASARYALSGWSQVAGWHAAFRWVRRDGQWLLEVGADHRMTDPIHVLLGAEGYAEELDAVHDFVQPPIEPEVAAAALRIGNQNTAIRTILERRGLHPWDRLNERALRWQSDGLDPHALFNRATASAARTIDGQTPSVSFLERKLEDALRVGLELEIDAARIGARTAKHRVPGWTSGLGALDLFIERSDGALQIAAELKIDTVEWVLWDMLKLANLFEAPNVEAAFLVVAADAKVWSSVREGAALFPATAGIGLIWDTRQLINSWRKSWLELLDGGPARPVYCPDRVEVESVATGRVDAYPAHEIRVVSIRPAVGAATIDFRDGWPLAMVG